MSSLLTAEQRRVFAGIADYLIPNAEGMPSASEVDVPGAVWTASSRCGRTCKSRFSAASTNA